MKEKSVTWTGETLRIKGPVDRESRGADTGIGAKGMLVTSCCRPASPPPRILCPPILGAGGI